MRLGKGINTITDNTTLRNFVQTMILSVCMSLSNNLSARNSNSSQVLNYPYSLELSEALTSSESVTTINLPKKIDTIEEVVDPDTIAYLVKAYLKNDVKTFSLSDSAIKEVEEILRTYLKDPNHTILEREGEKVVFRINNKNEFLAMLEKISKVIIPDIEKAMDQMSVFKRATLELLLLSFKEHFYRTIYHMPKRTRNDFIEELLVIAEKSYSVNKVTSRKNLQDIFNKNNNIKNPSSVSEQTAKL